MKTKIGIIGAGYVGTAMHRLFENHYEILVHDIRPQEEKRMHFCTLKHINENCEVVFVCVPTPKESCTGRCVTVTVEKAVQELEVPLIVIKSTVPPGTTDRLIGETGKNIVFSPEYCGESSYWTPYDFHTEVVETPFFIFGGTKESTSKCVDLFMPVCGPTKTYTQCTAKEAELTKYVENTFYATKIAFCYQIYEICLAAGIDWNTVRELWLQDPRINPMHTSVFPDNDLPFSGKCLPKDLSGLIQFAKAVGIGPELLEAVQDYNYDLGNIRKIRRKTDS